MDVLAGRLAFYGPSMQTLNDRIGVITGASAGIGLAIAKQYVAAGARIVINGRRGERLEAIAKELGADKVACVAGDCADVGVISAMLEMAEKRFGRSADLVVVNAGRGLNGSVMTSDTGQWEEMVRTNLLGAAHLIRMAGTKMMAESAALTGPAVLTRSRDIIVLGSTVGRHVSPFSSMYGSTKFAVHGLTEGARRELGPKGIRVSLIEPGFVVSEFQGVAGYAEKWVEETFARIGPPLTPEDIGRVATFIASQPKGVHVADVLIRPTRQDYP